jgi:aspartate carbamoyltransferase catalytic subunit
VPLKIKHLLGIQELSVEQIQPILETAESFREISTRPDQEGSDAARQDGHQPVF